MQSDPLNDAMCVIKNAALNGKGECMIQPSSKLIGRVLKVMQDRGYISQFEYVEDGKAGKFRVMLAKIGRNQGKHYQDNHRKGACGKTARMLRREQAHNLTHAAHLLPKGNPSGARPNGLAGRCAPEQGRRTGLPKRRTQP